VVQSNFVRTVIGLRKADPPGITDWPIRESQK
jgi:hypothetical protein